MFRVFLLIVFLDIVVQMQEFEHTNIQDGCIIDSTKYHTKIGNGVTVGHLASIHSATIHDHCLIGMGSLIHVQEGVVVNE
jgi:carbonic anhydrase/acetyltransferase-like protein (isoleucine patch superfamily)